MAGERAGWTGLGDELLGLSFGQGLTGGRNDGTNIGGGGHKLNGLGKETAIDPEIGAGDKAAGAMGGKENGGSGKFVGSAEAAHGGVSENGLGARCGGAVFLEKEATVLFRGKEAGGNGVDPDVMRRPFAGEKLREAKDGGFGGGVGDDAGEGNVGRDRSDVDDASLLFFDHERSEDLAGKEDAADEVEIEVGPPSVWLDGLDRIFRRDRDLGIVTAGGVEENGRGSEIGDNLLSSGAEGRGLGGVAEANVGFSAGCADSLDPLLGAFFVSAHHDDVGSCLG